MSNFQKSPNKRSSRKLSLQAYKDLAAAVIQQAVVDYALSCSRGVISRFAVTEKGRRLHYRGKVGDMNSPTQLQQLCAFFRPGGAMQDLLAAADFPISATAVRMALSRSEASGKWMFPRNENDDSAIDSSRVQARPALDAPARHVAADCAR